MTSRSTIAACTVVVLLTALAPATALASASGVLSCGATVTSSTVLKSDVTGCTADGLIVTGDRVTLDLNGHTVSGDGIPNPGAASDSGFDVGIRVTGTDVRVRNGSVATFDRGLVANASPGLRLTALRVHDNTNRGLMIEEGSDGARVSDNSSTDNGASGIAVVGSDGARVTHNLSERNVGGAGVRLDTASGAHVADNDLNGNTFGVQIEPDANNNTITRNDMNDDLEVAVIINFSNDNVVTHNRITGTGIGVTTESADRTRVTNNLVAHTQSTACDGCGIGIQIYGNDSVVARNTVLDSPRYGIEVDDFGDTGHSPATGNQLRDNSVDQSGIGIAIGPEAGGVVRGTIIAANIVTRSVSDGIQLAGPSTGLETSTVTRNHADSNGGFGIVAVPGTIDGGHNRAAGNGNPAQCLNIICR